MSVLAFICASTGVSAQPCSLEGTARLSDSKDHGGIAVQLLDSAAVSILDFKTTNERGEFRFQALAGPHRIYISQFGYQDTMIALVCQETALDLGAIVLFPLSIELGEISVVDKAALMRKSGDTTIFNIQLLEKGDEQSVTDIIARVPGFSIEDGYIYYQNKPVKDVLVEGKQIATVKDAVFTDGMLYESIADLRIIENYYPGVRAFADSTNSQLALDIKLKPSYKGKWQGTASGAAGYKSVYEAMGNALKANEGNAFSLNVKAVNTNASLQEDAFSEMIRAAENDMLFQNRFMVVRQDNPHEQALLPQGHFNRQENRQLSGAADLTISKNIRSRTKAAIPLTSAQQISSYERIFRSNGLLQSAEKSSRIHYSNAYLHQYLDLSFGQRSSLLLEFPVALNRQRVNRFETGSLGDAAYENSSSRLIQRAFLKPLYKYFHTFRNGAALSVFGEQAYERHESSASSISQDSIAGLSRYDPERMAFFGGQEQSYKRGGWSHQAQLRKQIGPLLFQAHAAYTNGREQLSLPLDSLRSFPFAGEDELRYRSRSAGIRLMYDRKKWRLASKMVLAGYQLSNELDVHEENAWLPSFLAMYRLGRRWRISASYSISRLVPTLAQTTALYRLQDQTQIQTGGGGLGALSIREVYSLSLFKEFSTSLNALQFNARLSYIPAMQEVQPTYEFRDFYQLASFGLIGKEPEWMAVFWIAKHAAHWSASLNGRFSVFGINEPSQGRQVYDEMLTLQPRLKYTAKNVAVLADAMLRYSQRQTGASRLANLYLLPRLSVKLERGHFHHQAGCQLQYNSANGGTRAYARFDYELTRKKWNKQFEYTLKCIDVFNLAATELSTTDITARYFQTSVFDTFPGQIMLGIKWYAGSR